MYFINYSLYTGIAYLLVELAKNSICKESWDSVWLLGSCSESKKSDNSRGRDKSVLPLEHVLNSFLQGTLQQRDLLLL